VQTVSITHITLATLLVLAMESGSEETGLSKGPENPAEIGSRCAVLAGRDDRAYLDCGKLAPQPTSRGGALADPSRPDPFGTIREGEAERYRLRGR
jgi:hypothetical protein